jgi:DNA-binding NtrC family response regulator
MAAKTKMKTILIVDDDKSVRESLKMILEYDQVRSRVCRKRRTRVAEN